MGNKKLLMIGIIIFVIFLIFPILYNSGSAGTLPNPEKPKDYKECVKDKQFMRTSHMVLINQWRDEVLREGNREKIVVLEKKYDKSLMNGCMLCHNNKKKFCDECHVYASVAPYCWDCHFVPKETI